VEVGCGGGVGLVWGFWGVGQWVGVVGGGGVWGGGGGGLWWVKLCGGGGGGGVVGVFYSKEKATRETLRTWQPGEGKLIFHAQWCRANKKKIY